jgi:PAS domain S-box-containing protein
MNERQDQAHRDAELGSLRARLAEAEETLRAIREGDVDALLITRPSGEQLYTLHTADAPYRAFVEQMQEGAVTLSDTGQITYCNKRFAELVGVPLEHIIGAPIDRFLADDAAHGTLATLVGTGSGTLRTFLAQKGGPSKEIHISLTTVSLEGEQQRTLIVTDTSTIAKAQRESREKDEFLAMLAHELRNPLGAISGAVQVLNLIEIREQRGLQARGVIERQVAHMARLMDDLLDVARMVTGKIVLDRRPVDLAQCVRGFVTAAASGPHGERHIELETQPVWVNGDPVRLEQIAGNLVSNALRFTDADRSVRVSVNAERQDAVLRVSDEGAGIDPDVLPKVFDLFTQGDRTRDHVKGGLGIGLTLVKRLAELHGGTVDAASEGAGCGSTFTVRLPRIAHQRLSTDPEPPEWVTPRMRVLLVDDNADSREMYGFVLQADGHEVYQAADGPTALEMFRRARPQVAVIDIGIPGMDGYDVAMQMRAETPGDRLVLIALTGYGLPEDRERSRTAGFDSHLVKPVAVDDLRRQLAGAGRPARQAK